MLLKQQLILRRNTSLGILAMIPSDFEMQMAELMCSFCSMISGNARMLPYRTTHIVLVGCIHWNSPLSMKQMKSMDELYRQTQVLYLTFWTIDCLIRKSKSYLETWWKNQKCSSMKFFRNPFDVNNLSQFLFLSLLAAYQITIRLCVYACRRGMSVLMISLTWTFLQWSQCMKNIALSYNTEMV